MDRDRRPALEPRPAGSALAVRRDARDTWLLLPSAIVLGSAYGLCLVAGLIEVQRIADRSSLGGLTAACYALTYIGFAAPYLLSLCSQVAGYPVLLLVAAALALATAGLVTRRLAGAGGRLARRTEAAGM